VMSPSPILFHTQWPGDAVLALHRRVNDELAQIGRAHPKRFAPLGTVPLQDPGAAVRELERCMAIGLHGIEIETHAAGVNLDDPTLRPLFAAAESLGALIFLHPLMVLGADRLRAHYLTNLLGNPYDTGIAAAHLIFGGVLDRLPKLQVILPHAGGTFPLVWGRLQRGQKVRPEANKAAKKPVKAYLRRFTYDTISHDAGALRYLIKTVGADRVMLGTDFCFDMGYDRPLDIIRDKAVKLSRADQAKVVRENAARLLRLR